MAASSSSLRLQSIFAAYCIWGLAPLYWKVLAIFPAEVVASHRVLWCGMTLALFFLVTARQSALYAIVSQPKILLRLCGSAALIGLNWGLFLYAVTIERVVEASVGYLLVPLMSVLFARLFFHEQLRRWQLIAAIIATIGIALLASEAGGFPWIGLILAVSFGLYSVVHKGYLPSASVSLFFETLILSPIALYLILSAPMPDAQSLPLLIFAGPFTLLPLILFQWGVRGASLIATSFIQYLAPVIQISIAVMVFGEPFSLLHFFALLCILGGMLLFTFEQHCHHRISVREIAQ